MIDRYLMGAAIVMLLFCAVAIGGWAMLRPRTALRRGWLVGAAALILYGGVSVATTLSLTSLRTTLAYHEDFHEGLVAALSNPRVHAALKRCPLLSLPDNKLIPDARWILDSVGQHDIVARSQARADAKHGAHAAAEPSERAAASRCIRSAARCSSRRSSTSATTPATRSRRPATTASTRAATTRSMTTAAEELDPAPERGRRDLPSGPARRGEGGDRRGNSGGGSGKRARRWAWSGSGGRARGRARHCGCGGCGRGCPTPTTPTRPTTSCRTRSRCSGTA